MTVNILAEETGDAVAATFSGDGVMATTVQQGYQNAPSIALQSDAQLLTDSAAAAIAANKVFCMDPDFGTADCL